jgi:hypothetical protein
MYTADYTLGINGKWRGTLRADATPDTTIDTGEHDDFVDAVGEVFDLVEPGADVALGAVTGDP